MTNHQSKPNKITMHPIIIATLLLVCSTAVRCKPNQQQQNRAADSYDKQLTKKQILNEEINLQTSGAQINATSAAAASAAAAANNFQCPEQFGYYTDTRDCTKYYVCVFGEVLHESCTGGLRFSRELQTCDWPRNVDCPHAPGNNSSSSSSSSSLTPPSSASSSSSSSSTAAAAAAAAASSSTTAASNSSPFPMTTTTTSTTATSSASPSSSSMATTTTPGSLSSLSGGHNRHHQHQNQHNQQQHQHHHHHHHQHHHHNPHNAKESSIQENEERSLKSSASLVFADEGSDPQQPSFDEAVSPVITPDGTIHLHDGSGGTFSLTPNHNRADHNQLQQQPQENQRPNNVDVFVKPIQLASQQQVTNANGQTNRARISQQQQLLSSSNSLNNQRQAGSISKLQPATLPEPKRGNIAQSNSQSNSHQNQNHHDHHHQQQQQQQQSQLQSAQNSLHNNGGHFLSNKNSLQNDNNDNNQASNAAGTSLDSESVNNGDEQPNDSIGAQADSESYEELSGQLSPGDDQSSIQPSSGARNSQENQQVVGGYIPPVMANTAARTLSGGQQQQQQQQQASNHGNRQSSQLLSFNNRQLQDNSRQSFKPILLSSSNPASHQHSSASINNDQRNLAGNVVNQRSGSQSSSSLAPFALDVDPSANMPFENTNDDEDPQQEDQTVRPSTNNNNNFNNQLSNQQPANNRQQQQGSLVRQNNQALRPQQVNSMPVEFNDRQLQQQQNNRQSRMSANFNQQAAALFTTSATPTTLAGAAAGERQPHSRATFLTAPDNQIMSNNVNFNDSSKLIRLQASHFEQLPPSSSSSLSLSPLSSASSLALDGNSNNNQQQVGLSNSFVPKFPARSQNVLFSQQPFGFVTDQSNNNDKSGALDHHHGGSSSSSAIQQVGAGGRQASNLNGDGTRLLHQQRRPRPPKRQQIPSGGQRRPAQQQLIPGNSNFASHLSHQPNQHQHQHQHLQQQMRPQHLQIDSADGGGGGGGGGGGSTTTSLPITTTNGNSFLSPHDASFMDVADEHTEQPPVLQPVTRVQGSLVGSSRPIVAPTTVNFQQQDAISSNAGGGGGGGFATLPTNFATTPSSGNGRLINGRRFNDAASAMPIQLVVGNSRTGTNVNGLSSNGNNNQHQLIMANQGQRSAQLISPSANEQAISPQGNAIPATSSLPIATTTATATSTTTTAATTAATTSATSGDNAADQQDPQLIANRYLNSAIDALEAGQPFGAVDYDFDILNDNSTDRRNPAGQLVNSNNNNIGINQTSLFNSNANANRQRQRTQATFGGGSVVDGEEEGENISLINGQPSGRAPVLGSGSSTRNSQSAGNGGSSSGRARNGQQQQAGTGGGGGRQQQQQQAALNNQADLFSGGNPPSLASSPSPSSQANQNLQQQQQQPTKKPRPTNRKIAVNHEQAIANNRASTEPARRPEALFATPNALQTATKCDNRHCRLPDCKCGDTLNPGGLDAKVIPQIVLLTFDDAVNDLNWEIYEELFTGRTNPNGCPILATFYVSHEWTDYGQVQTLYSRGHEMASHSVTHSFGEKFSKSQWFKEVNGQREILNMYGGVKMNDVRGMRAPFLQIGGNKMFEMLYDANFTYDSSMPIFENSPPLWPYTLDYQLTHECMITPCPTKSFPGVWEVGMTMWVDLRGGRCSMGDACSNPPDEDGVYEMLMKNFNRHYKSNRAPFGLFYHSAWFNTVHHRRGFLRFMGTVNSLSDVFFVTNWQMLQWMRKPTPISEINSFEPWQCPAKNDRPPPCFHPSVCNVKSEHGTRFMKTCQPCPVNQQYPWVGSTGFKGKQATGSG